MASEFTEVGNDSDDADARGQAFRKSVSSLKMTLAELRRASGLERNEVYRLAKGKSQIFVRLKYF